MAGGRYSTESDWDQQYRNSLRLLDLDDIIELEKISLQPPSHGLMMKGFIMAAMQSNPTIDAIIILFRRKREWLLGGLQMKPLLVSSIVLVAALAVPSFAFARAYSESSIGVGTTQLTNTQHSVIGPDNFSTSSLDLAAGASRYWAFSKAFWGGIGLTFAIPVSYASNGGLFSSPTSLSFDVPLRINITPELMITLKPSALAAIFQLYEVSDEYLGLGGRVSLELTYYLTKIIGILASVGYSRLQTQGYFLSSSPVYLTEGWFATAGLAFRFGPSL